MEKAKAIDVHTHPFTKPFGGKGHEWYMMGIRKYVRHQDMTAEETLESFLTDDEYAQSYRDSGVKGLPISPGWGYLELRTCDDDTARKMLRDANNYVAGLVQKYNDVFLNAWACVDPRRIRIALEETERAIKELRLLGLKFHQAAQEFYPNDKQHYPLWGLCQDLGIPVMFHVGYTGIGGMYPGGSGVLCLQYTSPLFIDEVARDFPTLKIICAHPASPYEEEMSFIWLHKSNVYRECSGWMPKYFPAVMVREMQSRCQDKIMFGTEGPGAFPPPADFLKAHEEFDYRPGVREKVLYKNAENILGLKN